MPTDESYFEYILEQLSELEDIRARKMFGEYILYYKDRIFGGIYDNRLLVKSVKAAEDHLKDITLEMPMKVQSQCTLWIIPMIGIISKGLWKQCMNSSHRQDQRKIR